MAKFEVPPLPYDYAALEPHIDTQTMQIHHDKHHAAYVTNLNNALEGHADLQSMSADDLIKNLTKVPENIRMAVRNNAGGHVNHPMVWQIMAAKAGAEPKGAPAGSVKSSVGDFASVQGPVHEAALGRFASGCAL